MIELDILTTEQEIASAERSSCMIVGRAASRSKEVVAVRTPAGSAVDVGTPTSSSFSGTSGRGESGTSLSKVKEMRACQRSAEESSRYISID